MPYHDYDGNSGILSGQTRYFILSNTGKSAVTVEKVTFVSALIANTYSDSETRIRYENIPNQPSAPKRIVNPERIGFRIEETRDAHKAWGQLITSRNQALPWSSEVKPDLRGRKLSNVAFLYVYNVRAAATQHGYIRCTLRNKVVGEQFLGPQANTPLLFGLAAEANAFDSRVTLALEDGGSNVTVTDNIELFFLAF